VGRNIDRTKGKKVVTRQQRQAEASRFDIVGGRKIPSLPLRASVSEIYKVV